MIVINDVFKEYSNDVKIGKLNIEIPRSGITSMIGPNGAGKSTTLLMAGRLLDMDAGSIEISGLNIEKADSDKLARTLAVLKQENHFITKLTVRQLVSFGRFPYSKGRLTEEDEEIISKYIDFLGLSEMEDRFLDQLSGGQRQRAYVAMVLAQDTEYILLDEPLNNLDIARSIQMMKHLRYACDKFGKTIVIVMHDINIAAKYSDKICIMKDGKISAFGSPQEIMKSEILTDLFGTQIDVIQGPHGPIAVY